ncbi:uncharacterized protein LOC115764038 [Drosophila novamexicana]|uniref:uncharacterized protein LOC115764038 n=1 Tax=Drosophila novamexicana TaxID=47314 RepID=UPI0011E5D9F2|nr:uncharacterized protein LOC115764038 [Drosophila novamexicana]
MHLTKLLLCISCLMSLGEAHSLPPAVQLGGAIVAAVEQDAEQEAEQEAAATAEQRWLPLAEQQLRQLLSSELSVEQLAKLLDNWTTEARGKQHKQKKLLKMLYPLLGAAVLAKLILLPLILKWLTALSASSFVMGKIALAAAGLLALKSIMSPTHERLEIVHASAPALKSYHGDLSSSGTSWMPIRQHYIPLGVAKAQANFDNKPFL